MEPFSRQQFSTDEPDLRQDRLRRLLQSAAMAALAVGFAAALPLSIDHRIQFAMTKAFADGGEGGDHDGGGEGGGGHDGDDHDGGDSEAGHSGPGGGDNSGPGEGGDHDGQEAGGDDGDDHEAGDDRGDDHEAGDDDQVVPGDDDGTPDQGPGDPPGTEDPDDDDGTADQGPGDVPVE